MNIFFLIPACHREWCSLDGGRGANLPPAGHQQTDIRDAEDLQQRQACHFQHLPMLSQGQNPQLTKSSRDRKACIRTQKRADTTDTALLIEEEHAAVTNRVTPNVNV